MEQNGLLLLLATGHVVVDLGNVGLGKVKDRAIAQVDVADGERLGDAPPELDARGRIEAHLEIEHTMVLTHESHALGPDGGLQAVGGLRAADEGTLACAAKVVGKVGVDALAFEVPDREAHGVHGRDVGVLASANDLAQEAAGIVAQVVRVAGRCQRVRVVGVVLRARARRKRCSLDGIDVPQREALVLERGTIAKLGTLAGIVVRLELLSTSSLVHVVLVHDKVNKRTNVVRRFLPVAERLEVLLGALAHVQ